jgi:hypothetical protein
MIARPHTTFLTTCPLSIGNVPREPAGFTRIPSRTAS